MWGKNLQDLSSAFRVSVLVNISNIYFGHSPQKSSQNLCASFYPTFRIGSRLPSEKTRMDILSNFCLKKARQEAGVWKKINHLIPVFKEER
jgi:hypothetical protein